MYIPTVLPRFLAYLINSPVYTNNKKMKNTIIFNLVKGHQKFFSWKLIYSVNFAKMLQKVCRFTFSFTMYSSKVSRSVFQCAS